MVADAESRELAEKGMLTSSCCPAFVKYVNQEFPDLSENISHNLLSPMAVLGGKYIKTRDENAKVIFIGPCTAKSEVRKASVKPYVDSAITFEELQALFDGKRTRHYGSAGRCS